MKKFSLFLLFIYISGISCAFAGKQDDYTTMAAFEGGGIFALHNDNEKWIWTDITGGLPEALGVASGNNGEWIALGLTEDNVSYSNSIFIFKDGVWQPVKFQQNPPVAAKGVLYFSRAIWDEATEQWYAVGAVADVYGHMLQGLWAKWKKGDQNWTIGLADKEFAFPEPATEVTALAAGKNHYACALRGSVYIADKDITSSGAQWVKQNFGTDNPAINSIAWGYDKWVAVGSNLSADIIKGQSIYYCNNDASTNLSWTPISTVFKNPTNLTDIKWNKQAGWFFIGTSKAGTSSDGIHWNTFDFDHGSLLAGPYITYDRFFNHWIAGIESEQASPELYIYFSSDHWDVLTDVGWDTFSSIASR